VRHARAVILFVIGVLAIVAGVLYLTQAAHSLPSFFPGYSAHALGKHAKRGDAGVAFGVVCIIAGAAVEFLGSRRSPLH
jgi:uncharacterized membrane protein HdeD (DUF308 family)